MKNLNICFVAIGVLLTLLLIPFKLVANSDTKMVLMVVSGHGQQQGKLAPGYEFDEFAKAYIVFKAHGVRVDVASPKGGAVEADRFDPNKPYNQQVLNDKFIMSKLDNTLAISRLASTNYDAVFIVGGKGAMFDLPKDKALKKLLSNMYQQERNIAAVCHGPAALVDVKLSDGTFLLAGKKVNGFTNQEEMLFGKKWMPSFDFMLEDKLVERGARFQSSQMMLNHVAIDKGLITGQNPASTKAVALALVESMGITPLTLAPFKDDKTLDVIAQILDGNVQAKKMLLEKPEEYLLDLVGMYGFYYQDLAADSIQLQHALTLMSLGQKAINNPRLDLRIAKAQHKLGDSQAAKATLALLIAEKPDFKEAKEMLTTLSL